MNVTTSPDGFVTVLFTESKVHSFKNVENFILWLFRYRCIICNNCTDIIHEIVPRSSGKESMDWKNRVTLCSTCHQEIHHNGTGEWGIKALKERRVEYLEMVGRSEYV